MTKWLSPLPRTRKIDPLPPPPPPDRSVGGWEGVFRNGSIFLHHRENEAGQKEEKRKEEEAIIIPSMSQVALAGSGWSLPASVRGFSKLTGVKMLRRRKLEKF